MLVGVSFIYQRIYWKFARHVKVALRWMLNTWLRWLCLCCASFIFSDGTVLLRMGKIMGILLPFIDLSLCMPASPYWYSRFTPSYDFIVYNAVVLTDTQCPIFIHRFVSFSRGGIRLLGSTWSNERERSQSEIQTSKCWLNPVNSNFCHNQVPIFPWP